MKVYGWQSTRFKAGGAHNQTREIVAAKSMAAAARAAGYERPAQMFNLGETWNADELRVALADPGAVYWSPINAKRFTKA